MWLSFLQYVAVIFADLSTQGYEFVHEADNSLSTELESSADKAFFVKLLIAEKISSVLDQQ